MKWLAALAALMTFTIAAEAYTFIPSSSYLKQEFLPNGKPAPSPWSASLRYGFGSNYADERKPRAYDHVAAAEIEYKINPAWSADFSLSAKAETINGQIPKGQEQEYEETVSPGTSAGLSYSGNFGGHNYLLGVHGEPLWDRDSRLEGHQGIMGASAMAKFNFFHKRFSMAHVLDGSALINTYHYGSNLKANPDYFWTYKWKNDLRFLRTWKVSYTFGAKVTRYLDGFVGYSYNNTVSLSKSWGAATAALSYDNGGFTDDGYIRLWYVDEYRRVARFMVSYAF